MTTDPAREIAAVVAQLAPIMKAAGFRKRRHAFNRASFDVVQVLNIQAGGFDPPGTVEIPGLRPNMHGRYTVNLGVYVPGMRRSAIPSGGWVNEYNCHLRRRIGNLLPEATDVWWNTAAQGHQEDCVHTIAEAGLPWLDRYPSAEAVLAAWRELGSLTIGLSPAGAVDIAALYSSRGEIVEAERVLQVYLKEDLSASHRAYLRDYLPRAGFGHLVPDL